MKYISFSLFGNDPKYVRGMFENVKLKDNLYKGWKIIVYYDSSVLRKTLEVLSADGVILKNMTDSGIFPTSWRFLAANEEDCELFICRDTDSRISQREELAVAEWESEDKELHIMRDHPHHGCAIMAGMWGMKGSLFDMREEILKYQGKHYNPYVDNWHKQTDQDFLRDVIYKNYATQEKSTIHTAQDFLNRVPWKPECWSKDFPAPICEDKYFIGEIFSFKSDGQEYREYQYKER
jgi:hypothetical protein